MWISVVLLGLAVGVLVGLMGIGGGALLVPALVYLLGMEQHLAQGTSLVPQLAPIGAGALYVYWKQGDVDWRAGLTCAAGFLLGGYLGGWTALRIAPRHLRGMFGVFLMVAGLLLWSRRHASQTAGNVHG